MLYRRADAAPFAGLISSRANSRVVGATPFQFSEFQARRAGTFSAGVVRPRNRIIGNKGLKGNDVEHFLRENSAIQPGTGFTTQPGVDAQQRTPGSSCSLAPNPNGVPQANDRSLIIVEPRWGSWDSIWFYLGCAVFTATPGFVVKPLSGL